MIFDMSILRQGTRAACEDSGKKADFYRKSSVCQAEEKAAAGKTVPFDWSICGRDTGTAGILLRSSVLCRLRWQAPFAASKSFEGKQDHDVCNHYMSNRDTCTCTAYYIREDTLRDIVLERIRVFNKYIRSDVDGFQEKYLQCRMADHEQSIRDSKKSETYKKRFS